MSQPYTLPPLGHLILAPSLLVLAAFTASCAPGDATPVWTDGEFEEWARALPQPDDPIGDAAAASLVDLGAVRVLDDERFLHLRLDVGSAVTIQGVPGFVEVILDADGDPSTGGLRGGVEGADLAVVVSRPVESTAWGRGRSLDALDPPIRGAGAGVRQIGPDGAGELESADRVGFLLAPTHSSTRFEARLARIPSTPRAGANPAAQSRGVAGLPPARAGATVRGRIRYLRGDSVLDQTPVFRHTLETSPGAPPPLLDAEALAKDDDASFRVVAWNVSDGSFRSERAAFQRVLGALAADVVLLDEIHADATADQLLEFSRGVRGDDADRWSWRLAEGGGRQRTAVGSPRFPLRGEATMARIEYPEGALERWLAAVGERGEVPWMAPPRRMARAETDGGLSATGAWTTAEERDILFVPVDLQSAGWDGSPRDRLREVQAAALNDAIARTLDGRADAGLIIGGDLNLVGSARPLAALRRGLGVDGGDLAVVRAPRLRDRSLATWRSTRAGDPFSPGRLDFVLYRDRALEVRRAFVFDAADMSTDALRELGLRPGDSLHSDHLPLVVDFLVR